MREGEGMGGGEEEQFFSPEGEEKILYLNFPPIFHHNIHRRLICPIKI